MWLLMRCGQMTIDKETNDCIHSSDSVVNHQALSSILQQLLNIRTGNRHLCDDILQHLTCISMEPNPNHWIMNSANKVCSFIRILVEVDRLVPDNRNIPGRFSTEQLVDSLLNLVRNDIRTLEITAASDSARPASLRRLRNFLRVLSLTSLDENRRADLETRLGALFREDHLPRLSVADFGDLSLELTSIVSLPITKELVARNALGIQIQLQQAEKERERQQARRTPHSVLCSHVLYLKLCHIEHNNGIRERLKAVANNSNR